MDLPELLEFAVAQARAAGPIALRSFRHAAVATNKAGPAAFDPVTQADRDIEAQLRARIRARYPSHGIAGEEHGIESGTSDHMWIIDPIDGTRAFITGMPLWGILLGLTVAQRCVLGVMHQPYLDETFFGSGDGAFLQHGNTRQALATAGTAALNQASLYCTSPDLFRMPAEAAAFNALSAHCRLRRFGGDCYAYCMLAMGCVDLVVESGLQPHDIIPLIPIIEGAGGVVTDWSGESAGNGGRVIAAANPALHASALAVLQQHVH